MIRIGITGTGSLIGQAIIKSIRHSTMVGECSLVGFDYFPDTVGSFWCDRHYILPDILKPDRQAQWQEALLGHIVAEKLQVLFVGVDFELPILARLRHEIKPQTGCAVMVSDASVIRTGNDKYLTYQFLKDHQLPHPQTWLPGEVDRAALPYPLIVKPRIGARSVGVHRVEDVDTLQRCLAVVKDPIIQECVGDDDTEYTCGVVSLGDKARRHIVLRRSLKEGNTYIAEYQHDFPETIYDYVTAISQHLQPYGACNYQLRLGHDGIPKLFEINPRHSGTTYMRCLFGFNEVEYILKHLQHQDPPEFQLTEGRAIRYYEEHLL
jgi:carbamoyl-phosphate synthase large subunit